MKTNSIYINLSQFCLTLVCILFTIAACDDVQSDTSYPDRPRDALYRNGSLISRDGGWTFGGGAAPVATVDPALWRAALATVATLPVTAADQGAGVIDTDSDNDSVDTRSRLHILVSDTVIVTQTRQVRSGGAWTDAPADDAAAQAIHDAILRRAGR